MAAHRYWRLYYLANGGTSNYASIQEIELHNEAAGADLTGSGTASASHYADGAAANAVDNNGATHWGSYSQGLKDVDIWWQYDFGAGNAYNIIEIAITSRTTYYYECPSNFLWQYSDDGLTWTTQCVRTGIAWTSTTTQTIDVSASASINTPYHDYFNGADSSSPDAAKWTVSGSPDIQSNRIEITDSESITSLYTFVANFSVQIDFYIPSPPAANSWNCKLNAVIDSTHQIYLSAERDSSVQHWQRGYVNGDVWTYGSSSRTNYHGSLKISRSGNTITCSARDGDGVWTNFSSAVNIGSVGNTMTISISNGSWDTNPSITCRYNNYIINSGYVVPESPTIEKFTGIITETGFTKKVEVKILTETGWVKGV
jgi:hypothetical protein